MAAKLSLAMIVRNEAAVLARALESARPWVDELVVIDTGSTDGTQDLARAHGARVVEVAWQGFAEARNQALDACTGDWVLVLDADETLDPASGPRLGALAATGGFVGHYARQRNHHAVGPPGDVPVVRFFPRHPALSFEGIVHETLQSSDPAFERRPSELLIHHWGPQTPNPDKAAWYESLIETGLAETPGDPRLWMHLGVSRRMRGDFTGALSAMTRALALAPRDATYRPIVYEVLVGCLYELGRYPEAQRQLADGLRDHPDYPPLTYLAALCHWVAGRLPEARASAVAAQEACAAYTGPLPLDPRLAENLAADLMAQVDAQVAPARRARVVWFGDDPAMPSLSSETSRQLTRRLATLGHTVYYVGYHRQGAPRLWEGVTLWPSIAYAGDAAAAGGLGSLASVAWTLECLQPDLVVSCGRAEQAVHLATLQRQGRLTAPWTHWATPEGIAGDTRIPTGAEAWPGAFPVGMNFRPLDDAAACRAPLSAGDRFVLGSVARNLPRHDVSALVKALDPLCHTHPLMLFWVDDPHAREVVTFPDALQAHPDLPHHRVRWDAPNNDAALLETRRFNRYYNAMDAFLSFAPPDAVDLAALEAAAAGIPVLNWHAADWPAELVRLIAARVSHDRRAQARRLAPIQAAKVVASRFAEALMPLALPPRTQGIKLNWYCTLWGSGSVNHGSRELVLALDRAGADVTVEQPFARFEITSLFPEGYEADYARNNPEAHQALRRILAKRPHDTGFTNVRFIVTRPEVTPWFFARGLARPSIEYTNSDNPGRLGAGYIEALQSGRPVWAVSDYVKRIHGAAGGYPAEALTHLHVVHHGVDPDVFHPDVTPVILPTSGRFTFLNCSFPRVRHKGLDLLLAAYAAEFAHQDDVALVLKLPDPRKAVAPEEYAEVAALVAKTQAEPGCPPITLLDADTPGRGDLARYYKAGDAYVHPSRWEACSLSLLEAAAVGIPLIATRWGGHTEYCPEALAYYVDGRPGANDFGRAVEPDLADLRRRMREVYQNPDEARARGLAASRHVREHFSWDAAAKRMIGLLGG